MRYPQPPFPSEQGPLVKNRRAVNLMGIPVVVQEKSKLRGLFTYGIPTHLWRTGTLNGGNGTASSVDGELRATSGTVNAGITFVESLSHPRYEPDRPYGWRSASPALPTGAVKIRLGCFTVWEGFYVEYNGNDGTVKAYTRRTTGIVAPSPEDHTSGLGAATTTSTLLYTCTLPPGAVVTAATLFDQVVQWRGVGDVLTLVNLEEAGMSKRLGVATDIWCSNPALPFRIEVEATAGGASKTLALGCVDVSSYSDGQNEEYDPLALASDSVAMDNTERPLLVIQAAGFLAGMPCTRDHRLHDLMVTVDAAATVRVRVGATIGTLGTGAWSIPDSTRGLVVGVGSVTATTSGGTTKRRRTLAAGGTLLLEDLGSLFPIRPLPGTLTTGANRGNPAYGELIVITIQKTTGGTVNATAEVTVESLY